MPRLQHLPSPSLAFDPSEALTEQEPAVAHGAATDATAAPVASAPLTEELRRCLDKGHPGELQYWIRELKRQVAAGELPRDLQRNCLLDALGDSDLGPTNKAAPIYLHELALLRSKCSSLPLPGARPWPEKMVAAALVSTCPRSLSDPLWPEDAQRPEAIRRWFSRVTGFIEAGLIRQDRCSDLLLKSGSDVPLPHKALQQGHPDGAEFAAVIDGYARAGRANLVKGEALVKLLRAPWQGQTVMAEARALEQPRDVQACLAAAHDARASGALNDAELLRVIAPASPGERK